MKYKFFKVFFLSVLLLAGVSYLTAGVAYGASIPTLTTSPVTNITQNSATSGGNITSDGGAPVTARGVAYTLDGGTLTYPTIANSHTTDGSGTGSFTSNFSQGLSAGRTYYVRAYATNSAGTAYGNRISFTTKNTVLTVTKVGAGSGTVTSSPDGINCGTDCSEAHYTGTSIVLTALPASGSSFTGWSGCSAGTGTGPCTIVMNSSKSITAVFAINIPTYTLTINTAGNGSGTVTSSPVGINCGTDCSETYNSGTSIVLTALPASGSSFTGWNGGGCTGTGPCTVAVTSATSVMATFAINIPTYTLTINKAGDGSGTVTGAGIYNSGQTATATASASAGSTLAGWSGDCSGVNSSVSILMNANKTCTATFSLVTVSVVAAPTTYNTNPSTNVSFTYTPTTNTASAECNLLDNVSSPLTTYKTGTSITYASPSAEGAFGYYIQCRNAQYTSSTAKSDLVTVNVAPLVVGVVPTVTTRSPITNITQNSAIGVGNVTSNGGSTVTVSGLTWSTSTNPTYSPTNPNQTTNGWADPGYWLSTMIGLSPGTLYHVRAYAKNSAGVGYGSDIQFTTSSSTAVPSVANPTVSNITATGATLGADVVSLGLPASISARGICYGTSNNPTSPCIVASGTTTGAYTVAVTGLTPGTKYYYRGYATNATGTGYTPVSPYSNTDQAFTTISTAMTGTLTSSGCIIASGSNSCTTTLIWNTANAPAGSTSVVTTNYPSANTVVATGNKGTKTYTMNYGARNFYLYNNTVQLAQVTVTPVCASSTVWDSSANKCNSVSGTLSPATTSCIISAGQNSCNVTLSWSVKNYGGKDQFVISASGMADVVLSGTSGNQTLVVPSGSRTFSLYAQERASPRNPVLLATSTATTTSGNPPPPQPFSGSASGTLTPASTSCIIGLYQRNCPVNLSWTVTNRPPAQDGTWISVDVPGARTVKVAGGETPVVNSGTAYSIPVSNGSHTLYLDIGTRVSPSITTNDLARATATAACAITTSWNGTICTSSATMSGTLSANPASCNIPAGASGCDTTLSWDTKNPPAGSVSAVTTPESITVGTGNSDSKTYSMTNGSRNFYLYNNGQLLNQTAVTATCTDGVWDGSKCSSSAAMSGTLTASPNPCAIPSGASSCSNVKLNWSTLNPPVGSVSAVTTNYPTDNTLIANGNNGVEVPVTVKYNYQKFFLFNNGKLLNLPSGLIVNSSCATGTAWNGSTCASSAAVSYTITALPGNYGSITPAGTTTYYSGANRIYYITPNAGYKIANVLVDDVSVGAAPSYNFPNISANHTISANFAVNPTGGNPLPPGESNCSAGQTCGPVSPFGSTFGSTHYSCTESDGITVTESGTEPYDGTRAWTWKCGTSMCYELKKIPTGVFDD